MDKKKRSYYYLSVILLTLLFAACGAAHKTLIKIPDNTPKREFRGAWIHTVGQSRYTRMNSAVMRHYLKEMVRKLDEAGINVLVFQIRPEADAFYKSNIEPWSRFLTGEQGKAPDDNDFDPLALLVEECHKRGMELHAWLNPYRVQSNKKNPLAKNHIYWQHPERFIEYGNQLFFDPGLPVNRAFICNVVRDIVSRYKVDAIHMDDYFYPYPIADKSFPDDASFNRYASMQGFSALQRDDWRRNNVNLLIQELKYTISSIKPWIRFGISPFGIYRNKHNTPDGSGSKTNGLQNYDDLYADILLWLKNGWIDYNVPQLYWETTHPRASYTALIDWWNKNTFNRPLYIGQSLPNSLEHGELDEKIYQARRHANIEGNCFWYGYLILDNDKGVADKLKNDTHRTQSLIPAYAHMHKKRPKRVADLKEVYTEGMHFLTWRHEKQPNNPESAKYFVIYRFKKGKRVNIKKAENILKKTNENYYLLPYENGKNRYTYVVTAVDAFQNESKGTKIKVSI